MLIDQEVCSAALTVCYGESLFTCLLSYVCMLPYLHAALCPCGLVSMWPCLHVALFARRLLLVTFWPDQVLHDCSEVKERMKKTKADKQAQKSAQPKGGAKATKVMPKAGPKGAKR